MNRTWLIQRLQKPRPGENELMESLAEGLSFGGGFKNGGFSNEAMNLLRPIFSFDYMGAAEFEFGAVPKSLSNIANNIKNYCQHKITINGKNIFIFCKTADTKEVEQTLTDMYDDEYKFGLKEYPRLKDSLGEGKFAKDTIGWLELDNDFFFFKDQDAFKNVVKLFLS